MNPRHPSLSAYTRATHTVAKTRQVVMLYDGAIRFMKQAAEAMEQGAIEERYNKLRRASDVIMGLQGSLDFESGRDTAQILYEFYAMIDNRIIGLHRHPDAAQCQQVIAELKSMRDVWDGIDRGAESGEASAAQPVAAEAESTAPAAEPLASGSVKFSA